MYAIRKTRVFYGPTTVRAWVHDEMGFVLTLPTLRAAKAWIAEAYAEPYELAHNEAQRPEYSIRWIESAESMLASHLADVWPDDVWASLLASELSERCGMAPGAPCRVWIAGAAQRFRRDLEAGLSRTTIRCRAEMHLGLDNRS
jgi:hypothetical protein